MVCVGGLVEIISGDWWMIIIGENLIIRSLE